MNPPPTAAEPSLTHGRWCIVLAALFWSLSGAFTRVVRHDTGLLLGSEAVGGVTIAFYRALFAGLVLLPTLRRRDLAFRPLMLLLAAIFFVMNLTFVLSLALGKSSNAIYLQYTAPMWMYLASVWLLGEPADRRSSVAVGIGLAGVAVIVVGGWQDAQLPVVGVALVSGVTYAAVLVCLRVLRGVPSRWLTVWDNLTAAVATAPLLLWLGWQELTAAQLGVLFLFGAVQMGLPYFLVARGLRVVSPQEAGTITLLEPLLNPLWAFLVAPDVETPSAYTMVGGVFILGALAWRYWPRRGRGERPR